MIELKDNVQQIWKLSEVLDQAESFKCGNALYMNVPEGDWNLDLPCAVLDPEDSPDPGTIHPALAQDNSMRYVLFIENVQDVIHNARAQEPEADLEDLIQCLQFYWENDAFIVFE